MRRIFDVNEFQNLRRGIYISVSPIFPLDGSRDHRDLTPYTLQTVTRIKAIRTTKMDPKGLF